MKRRFLQYEHFLNEMLRYAMLRADIILEYGLSNGKMGMIILFYEYSHLYNDNLYKEYADKLLNSILDELPDTLTLDIKKGLSGIAWGIVYLYNRNFIEGKIQEILEDIDRYLIENIKKNEVDILSYFSFRHECIKSGLTLFSRKEKMMIERLIKKYQSHLYTNDDIITIIWDNWIDRNYSIDYSPNIIEQMYNYDWDF